MGVRGLWGATATKQKGYQNNSRTARATRHLPSGGKKPDIGENTQETPSSLSFCLSGGKTEQVSPGPQRSGFPRLWEALGWQSRQGASLQQEDVLSGLLTGPIAELKDQAPGMKGAWPG